MPSQSTERKKNWHSQTRLVCDQCCALVNSFLNEAIVATCPESQLALIYPNPSQNILKTRRSFGYKKIYALLASARKYWRVQMFFFQRQMHPSLWKELQYFTATDRGVYVYRRWPSGRDSRRGFPRFRKRGVRVLGIEYRLLQKKRKRENAGAYILRSWYFCSCRAVERGRGGRERGGKGLERRRPFNAVNFARKDRRSLPQVAVALPGYESREAFIFIFFFLFSSFCFLLFTSLVRSYIVERPCKPSLLFFLVPPCHLKALTTGGERSLPRRYFFFYFFNRLAPFIHFSGSFLSFFRVLSVQGLVLLLVLVGSPPSHPVVTGASLTLASPPGSPHPFPSFVYKPGPGARELYRSFFHPPSFLSFSLSLSFFLSPLSARVPGRLSHPASSATTTDYLPCFIP